MNKPLIFGNGWLGNILKDYFDGEIWIGDILIDFQPETAMDNRIWINTAAKTNIDWCEKNKEEALHINTLGAVDLAREAREHSSKYVFFSSACVFESKDINDIKTEDSIPNPQCFYSFTKYMAEQLIMEANPDALIIRLRLPLSEKPHPRNTLDKLLKYPLINNNQESWTIVEDMLPVLKELIEKDEKGIFHLINDGTMSPAEVAAEMGHAFTVTTKKEQDERLAGEGRAKRVSAYIGSKKILLLPNIRERVPQIIAQWKK